MMIDGGGNVTDTIDEARSWTTNGTVSQTLSGAITLQSVESTITFDLIAPRLILTPADGGTPIVVIPDSDGTFEFMGLMPWSYEISAAADGFMSVAKVEFPVGGSPVTLFAPELRAGLANRDDVVNIRDISTITASFGAIVVGRVDGLGNIVDMNADGMVDIRDISAVAANFGSTSPQLWP